MGHRLQLGTRTTAETLTGTRTITRAELEEQVIFCFDPGGAGRNVDLPTSDTNLIRGEMVVIQNCADAAEDLTVRNATGTTIATVSQNESGIFWSTGSITVAGTTTYWAGGVLKNT